MIQNLRRLFRLLSRDAVMLWYACRHPRAPGILRAGALLLLLYVLSPIDIVPDWFPILGWLDDMTLFALGIPVLLKLAPVSVLEEARTATDMFLSRLRPGR